jgi:predicted transcriptional regulator
MDYTYDKDGAAKLIDDLLNIDRYSMSNIADVIGLSRGSIQKYLKKQMLISKENFDKLVERRGDSDLTLYNHFINRLAEFNPLAFIPDDISGKHTQRQWVAHLYSIEKKVIESSIGVDIKRIIDFALSSYCPVIVQTPMRLNQNIGEVVAGYRQYASTIRVGKKNRAEVAGDVAEAFLQEFPKFIRTDSMITTDDSCLAHAVAKLGGCNQIANMDKTIAKEKLKFAYLDFLKTPPSVKKTVIRNGKTQQVIKLKDFR